MTHHTSIDPGAASHGEAEPQLEILKQATGRGYRAGNPFLAAALGMMFSLGFYGVAWLTPWGPIQRYFLGHPISIAATILFWFALAVLICKWFAVIDQRLRLSTIRDEDLLPSEASGSPAEQWLEGHDARHVSQRWLAELTRHPDGTRASRLVQRLEELLVRQSQRGTTKHLADDLRELSGRDADAAHDSLGLVRIIVWAIPMLGFLGTVIGITQTLGGLDFSNGTAAVDNLKSGLYVAFDTTALGLVLSVLAIFLQFPVERSEQRFLQLVDGRVGHLVSACLPSDEASDNQTVLIADLCRGVQAAVAESLENQARLWRETIDTAQSQWQSVHDENNHRVSAAIEDTLVPALHAHAESMATSSRASAEQLSAECQQWQITLDGAVSRLREINAASAEVLTESIERSLRPALQDHASSLHDSARRLADQSERQHLLSQQTGDDVAATLDQLQQSLHQHAESIAGSADRADALIAIQQAMDGNLTRLSAANETINQSIQSSAGYGMADAMRVLARAVDVLTAELAARPASGHSPRQAA